jgi:hypothetical protein
MKYFTNDKREQSGQLFQRSETSNPFAEKLEAIKRMRRNGVSKIFAPNITASDIEQNKPVENDGC